MYLSKNYLHSWYPETYILNNTKQKVHQSVRYHPYRIILVGCEHEISSSTRPINRAYRVGLYLYSCMCISPDKLHDWPYYNSSFNDHDAKFIFLVCESFSIFTSFVLLIQLFSYDCYSTTINKNSLHRKGPTHRA